MGITISLGFSAEKVSRDEKGISLLLLPSSYTVIDLETTGLDPQWNDIIEFGALRVEDSVVVDRFSSLVNPGYEIDDFITELTGITNEMLSTAPDINNVLQKFLDFIGDSIVIGHNVNFDINFIYDTCIEILHKPFKNNFIDTMRLSRRLFPQERHHRLCDLIDRFCVSDTIEHRALADAEQTNRCYLYMKQYMEDNGFDIKSILPTKNTFSAKDIQASTNEFDETSPIYAKVFVFTGTLERMTRKEAMQIVVDNGGKCGDGVNKNTNYLVLGNYDYCTTIKGGKSTKQKKAEQLKLAGFDIEIISENVFYDMITYNKE
ncbi:MAG: exonuclease domain-containing protein [Faecalispora sporosphaeroides]|uniref:exonuclease domain-containing protein n=1 Tax=Faecalispora sporosphaeroides TaxID=1549 RepID=UPI003994EB0F